MTPEKAVEMIHEMILRPGYFIDATPSIRRYEDSVNIIITCDTRDTGTYDRPDMWKEGYPVHVMAPAAFTLMVGHLDELGLYRAILDHILAVETHEWREFLRNPHTGRAPFHPHTEAGMANYGHADTDITYGLNHFKTFDDES